MPRPSSARATSLVGALSCLIACAALFPGKGLAADRVYWVNGSASNSISFANLDGSGGADLSLMGATPGGPFGLALYPAAGRIYWADPGVNKISFANLDGSGGGGDLITRAPR